MKYKILLILLVVISFSACGGGGSSKESPSDSENNADDIKNTSSIETEAVMLSNLQGLWRGELKVFADGTETPECIWDVSLDLNSTRVIDGSKFKGDLA